MPPVARLTASHDALVVVSFGGPEGPDDVMPFLENVTRGRGIPPARLAEVAGHYARFGGVSPINAANRALVAALRPVVGVPVYWGNRNWHPFLTDTVRRMAADGIRRAAAFVTSAYDGYSAARQYLDDIAAARAAVGEGAPEIEKLPPFYDRPGFIGPFVEATDAGLDRAGPDAEVVFTAHSVPTGQDGTDAYRGQVEQACRLVVAGLRARPRWSLAWQSRSGPPSVPWLEPDVGDHLAARAAAGARAVVLVPIGFVSDHREVVYDLDVTAAATAADLGISLVRVPTPGVHPAFVAMVADLLGA